MVRLTQAIQLILLNQVTSRGIMVETPTLVVTTVNHLTMVMAIILVTVMEMAMV